MISLPILNENFHVHIYAISLTTNWRFHYHALRVHQFHSYQFSIKIAKHEKVFTFWNESWSHINRTHIMCYHSNWYRSSSKSKIKLLHFFLLVKIKNSSELYTRNKILAQFVQYLLKFEGIYDTEAWCDTASS